MNEPEKEYASPPCSLQDWQTGEHTSVAADIASWRDNERKRLLAQRRAMDSAARLSHDQSIMAHLDQYLLALIGSGEQPLIAVYWPIRGEPDLRRWYSQAAGRGWRLALPAVVRRDAALSFRSWCPGDELRPDLLNIPAPAACDEVEPAVIITPFVGYDRGGYRLGNGGGYYDRSLPAMARMPQLIAVGDHFGALRSIYPQPHDIPMNAVVTEQGVEEFASRT
ncbi:5-formyltetrahydrofolate cyclo-ligase [Woeseia oceani]|uniref:5-formyltetrahydrofolate cyclo-ligase n=1 Tax=Woeseia oceani TaxID=1548547 RepID=A0A193LJ38_9GAMM|nr:5-formyltetrahydrofolate cyclo-ligase [Woeseia oceani]ANO52463.1 5-formyltetrahydrofolate cyclo-ligase [Woeseia oceani]